ncbi:MAG: hypothetical protein HOP11_05490 [Saprospiraceae bacterium]|nr:hypothetical protein [Saprospiraceae bacterium]
MKAILLKLDDEIFQETERILSTYKKVRNTYINEAIHSYNLIQKRKQIEQDIAIESKLVRSDSMKILKEFEKIENGV